MKLPLALCISLAAFTGSAGTAWADPVDVQPGDEDAHADYVAVSNGGSAHGEVAVAVEGDAHGGVLGVSVLGDACASGAAVAVVGDAGGEDCD